MGNEHYIPRKSRQPHTSHYNDSERTRLRGQKHFIAMVYQLHPNEWFTLDELREECERLIEYKKQYQTPSLSAAIRTLCSPSFGWKKEIRLRNGIHGLYEYRLWLDNPQIYQFQLETDIEDAQKEQEENTRIILEEHNVEQSTHEVLGKVASRAFASASYMEAIDRWYDTYQRNRQQILSHRLRKS